MKLRVGLIVFCAVLCVGAVDRGSETRDGVNNSVNGMVGFGLELLLTKFDVISNKLRNLEDKLQQMDNKLQKVENEIIEQRSGQRQTATALDELRSSQKQSFNEMLSELLKLKDHVAHNVSGLRTRNQEKIEVALRKLDQDVGLVLQKQENPISSCKNVPSNVSGTYQILVKNAGVGVQFRVYCEQQKYGGGWIVIQHRFDGSLDFYRGWNEFRDGFGDLEKEFWLGLEKMHRLTKGRRHELIVELKYFNGTYKYARYDAFEIGNEREKYVLKDIGAYDAGDGMKFNKDEKFSTKDRNNGKRIIRHCAHVHEGAWWHWGDALCTRVNLNGKYMNAEDDKSMHWGFNENRNRRGLSYSRMMIREVL